MKISDLKGEIKVVKPASAPAPAQQPNNGFVGNLLADITRTPARAVLNLKAAAYKGKSAFHALGGDMKASDAANAEAEKIRTQGVTSKFHGNIKPIGVSGNAGRDLIDTFGAGAELSSLIVPAGGAREVAVSTFRNTISRASTQGALGGGGLGLLYGAGREMQNPDATVRSVAYEGAKGTLLGGAGGAVLGSAASAAGYGINRLKNGRSVESIVARNTKGLQKLEDAYAPVRTVLEKHKARGIDTKNILAQTDLLVGAVDDTGTLRTQNAIHELNAFIKPHEDVISANLAREGVSLSPETVRAALRQGIQKSGLQGGAYTRALKTAEDDLAGYLVRTADDKIPLELIHKAKVDKYANINYLNPESKRADKAIAKALKELVERHTNSVDVKALNQELSTHFSVLDLLEKLDGRKVQGGKLGKYFAQTIGSIVGSHFGPLGSIVGAELGGRVRGAQMASNFSNRTGKGLQKSAAMEKAVQQGKLPPLGLPAPKPGTPKKAIYVPQPAGPASSIEPQAQKIGPGYSSNSLGSLQIPQAKTNTQVTNNNIPTTITPKKKVGSATMGTVLGGSAAGLGLTALAKPDKLTAEAKPRPNEAIISLPDRNVKIKHDELEILRKVLYAEIGSRGAEKSALEAKTITDVALNRASKQKKTLSEVLTAPKQFQGYNSKLYKNFETDSATSTGQERLQAIDQIIEQLKSGNFPDSVNGYQYYVHLPDGRIRATKEYRP